MLFLRARYLQVADGRFITRDVWPGDETRPITFNSWAYGGVNPVKFMDPSGRMPCGEYCQDDNFDPTERTYAGPDWIYDWHPPYGEMAVFGIIGLTGAAALEGAVAGAAPAASAGVFAPLGSAATGIAACSASANEFTTSSVWQMDPWLRGQAIEDMLGRSRDLVSNFPTIDRFRQGVATSIKSIDLRAATYQDPAKLLTKLTGYVNTLDNWPGQLTPWGNTQIDPGQVTQKVLELAIPASQPGAIGQAQMNAIQQAQHYADRLGIILRMIQIW